LGANRRFPFAVGYQGTHLLDRPKINQHNSLVGLTPHEIGRFNIPMNNVALVDFAEHTQHIQQ
jgi:hypothetical protein